MLNALLGNTSCNMDNQFSSTPGAPESESTTIPVTSAGSSATTPNVNPQPTATPVGGVPTAPSSFGGGAPSLSATPTVTTTKMSPDKSHGLLSTILMVLLLVVVIGAIAGIYEWQHKKVNTLNAQVSSLSSQVTTLTTQNSKLKSSSVTVVTPSSSNNTTTFKITQLGVEFSLPATLADANYEINTQANVANVSTTNLAVLDPACIASPTGTKALGTISKVTGTYKTSPTVQLVKQYPSYYIGYSAPTAPCSTVAQVNTLVTSLVTQLKQSLTTIKLTTS